MAGKVVKQLAGSGTGQSLSDLMMAMKYTLSGSVVVKIICKATTEEMCAPKRKHLSYLVQCTFEPRLSIPDFANQLIIRTQHGNLVVVFKALLTIHHLMQFGNERFSQYIASNNCHFYIPSLLDRNSVQAHGISLFLRPYAKYLDEKAASYREVAFDFCRLKRGKEDGDMRTMPQDKLMKTLPVIEKQLDALLMFDATTNELSNSLLRVAHLSLYRDLIRLYAVYNEGMINLIGRYFTMSKRDCRLSLEIYKNFLQRMEALNTFVKVAESTESGGTPLSENNSFKPVPPSVLEALEEHLAYLEGHKQADKKITTNLSPQLQTSTPTSNPPSSSQPTANHDELTYSTESTNFILTTAERQRIIEEERARLESFVSSAKQHKFSADHHEHAMMSNISSINSNNNNNNNNHESTYYDDALKLDNENFLDLLLSFNECSTAMKHTKQFNNHSSASTMPIEQSQQSTLTTEQNLLQFNDISTNSLSHPLNINSQLFLPTTNQSTIVSNSLVPVMMSPASSSQLHSTNPFLLINTNPQQQLQLQQQQQLAITPKNYALNQPAYMFNPPTTTTFGQIQPSNAGTPTTVPSESIISLDDKIAQIAGNLSIRDYNNNYYSSSSSTQTSRIYRAPDGSLSSVNWSGTLPITTIASNPHHHNSITMHQSSSLNQLVDPFSVKHQQPPQLQQPMNSTNPWATATSSPLSGIQSNVNQTPSQLFMNHNLSNGIMINNRPTSNNPFLS
ncbi:unnamed protein product [Schistosoma turkestanicum]|nr:unnamed protein product [Schistosoma turkestanicum]